MGFGLRDLSPQDGARIASEETGQPTSVEDYACRIKKLGLRPMGHVEEWKKYGIVSLPNPELNN
jgi:hypothetical protein